MQKLSWSIRQRGCSFWSRVLLVSAVALAISSLYLIPTQYESDLPIRFKAPRSQCSEENSVAVHLIHFMPILRAAAVIRHRHVQRIISELEQLPFERVYFFIHTNIALSKKVFKLKQIRNETTGVFLERKVVIQKYEPRPWWVKLNGNVWSALTWAARDIIKKSSRTFDIVMCLDDDLFIPVKAITKYWCIYAADAFERGHYLSFLIYDETPKSSQYPEGWMSFLRHKLDSNVRSYIERGTQYHYAHVNYSYKPDYYVPLWILDKKRFRAISRSHKFFFRKHAIELAGFEEENYGYAIKNLWNAQEEAYFSIFTEFFAQLPVLGASCNSVGGCHVHPYAFIHHLPNNYGNNRKYLEVERPKAVDEIFCIRGVCPNSTQLLKST
eukprot:PhF_6_TR37191/c1_g1_i1/m.54800